MLTDLAYQILLHEERPLANFMDENGVSPLHLLADKPSVFKSGCRLGWWSSIIYYCKCFLLNFQAANIYILLVVEIRIARTLLELGATSTPNNFLSLDINVLYFYLLVFTHTHLFHQTVLWFIPVVQHNLSLSSIVIWKV